MSGDCGAGIESLGDVIAAEGTIVVAAVAVLTYVLKIFGEPVIMGYAA